MRRIQEDERLIQYRVRAADMVFLMAVLAGIAGSYLVSYTGIAKNHYQLGILLSELVYFLPVCIFFLWEKKKGIQPFVKKRIGLRRVKPLTVVLTVLFSISIYPVMQLVNMLSLFFVKNKINATIVTSVQDSSVWMGLLVFAVVPAVTEEIIYRGFFYQSYRELGRRRGAIFSAFVFGLMHLNFNQFLYAFLMGLLFAVIMEITDSLWPCIITHFVINGSSVLLTSKTSGQTAGSFLFKVVAGFIFSAVLLYLIAEKEGFLKQYKEEVSGLQNRSLISGQHPGVFYLGASVLCLTLMILGEIA